MAKAKSLDRTTYSCFQFHSLPPLRASPRRSRYRSASIISTVFPISPATAASCISPAHLLPLRFYRFNRIFNFPLCYLSAHLPAHLSSPHLYRPNQISIPTVFPISLATTAPRISPALTSPPRRYHSNRVFIFSTTAVQPVPVRRTSAVPQFSPAVRPDALCGSLLRAVQSADERFTHPLPCRTGDFLPQFFSAHEFP